ncbi:MAG: stalk domain-containing protein [Bacillota bacterium]|nr:stalk domain-containing protein [Bacillota bacterium]
MKKAVNVFLCVLFLLSLRPGEAMAVVGGNYSHFAFAQNEIRIFLNGQEIFMDTAPVIEAGRTLVPARFVLEAMGAVVEWNDSTSTVFVKMDEKTIELPIGNRTVRINGSPLRLDVPARLIGNRTFIPLRFVTENLGAEVYWDAVGRTIYLQLLSLEEVLIRQEYSPYYRDLKVEVETYGIALGDTAQRVILLLGEPARKDATIYGYTWWIYNRDMLNYLQVGIKDGKVMTIYSCGGEWNFGTITRGSRLFELEEGFSTSDVLYVDSIWTAYKLHLPTLIFNNMVATFYYDAHDQDKITAVRLEDREVAVDRYVLFFKHRSSGGSSTGKKEPLPAQIMRDAEAGDERQIFDLVNAERARRGLPVLNWHGPAALAALGHSTEMFIHDYFSHYSEVTGKALDQRLDDQRIVFTFAAENIARGQLDGIEVHHGLMNSYGHRENILHKNVRSLGVGVYRECYTQNFVTER